MAASGVVVRMRAPMVAAPSPTPLSTRFSLPLAIVHVADLLEFVEVISGVFVPLVEVEVRIVVPFSFAVLLTRTFLVRFGGDDDSYFALGVLVFSLGRA